VEQGTLGNQETISVPRSKGRQGVEVKETKTVGTIYLFDDFVRTSPSVRSGNGPRDEQMGWTFEAHTMC